MQQNTIRYDAIQYNAKTLQKNTNAMNAIKTNMNTIQYKTTQKQYHTLNVIQMQRNVNTNAVIMQAN
jgi:hypothetical protein